MVDSSFYVHPTAEVEEGAQIGAGTRIWRQAQVRTHASVGEQCNIGKGVYIDADVRVGSRVKIQNHVSVFEGVTIEDGVFVGSDSTLVAPVKIGRGAYVGAASCVTTDVPSDSLALGRAVQVVKEGWARKKREERAKK